MKRIAVFAVILFFFVFGLNAQTVWELDKLHSNLDFSVRYMMLSSVRGSFGDFDAKLTQHNEDFSGSDLDVSVTVNTINTLNNDRDNHLRSDDFFNVEKYPDIRFVTRSFEKTGNDDFRIQGDLTIRDVTKPVEIKAKLVGIADDPRGFKRAAFTGETNINREEFNVRWNRVLEAGGFMVGNNVTVTINAQFIKQ